MSYTYVKGDDGLLEDEEKKFANEVMVPKFKEVVKGDGPLSGVALCGLGLCYTDTDAFQKSIEKGCVEAMEAFALYYFEKYKLEKKEESKKESIKYFKMAVENWHPQSMLNLGFLLQDEEFKIIKSFDVFDCYAKLINTGEEFYQLSKGAKRNNLKHLKKASELGHAVSKYLLGHHFMNYFEPDEAKKYFLEAVEQGHVESMFSLGFLYGQRGDSTNMEKYYKMASEQGQVESMHYLGCYYKSNDQYNEMKQYFEMAIEKGDSKSEKVLSKYYTEDEKLLGNHSIDGLRFFHKHKKHFEWGNLLEKNLDCQGDELLDYLLTINEEEVFFNYIPYILRKLLVITRKQIDNIELHFKYTLNGKGYEEAKKDYLSLEKK